MKLDNNKLIFLSIASLFFLLFVSLVVSHKGVAYIRYVVLLIGLFCPWYFLKILKTDLSIAIFSFFLIALASLLFNNLPVYESVRVLNWYLAFFAGCFFAIFLNSKTKILYAGFYSYILSYIILFILLVFSNSGMGFEKSRYLGFTSTPNAMGELIGLGVIFLMYVLVKSCEKKNYRIVTANVFLIIISAYILFETGSRTAFFVTIFMTIVILFLELRIKKYLILLSTLFVLVFLILLQNKLDDSRIFHNITDPFSISSMQARLPIYNAAWNCFVERPILGYGFTNFGSCYASQKNHMEQKYTLVLDKIPDAHNFILQFLAETGLLGFFIIMYIFIKGCYLSFKHFRVAFYVLIAMFLFFMINMNLYLRELSTIFFLMIGLSFFYRTQPMFSGGDSTY